GLLQGLNIAVCPHVVPYMVTQDLTCVHIDDKDDVITLSVDTVVGNVALYDPMGGCDLHSLNKVRAIEPCRHSGPGIIFYFSHPISQPHNDLTELIPSHRFRL